MTVKNTLTQGQKIGVGLLIVGLAMNGVLMFFAERQWQTISQRRTELEQQIGRLTVMERLGEQKPVFNDRFEKLVAFFPAKEEEVAEVAQKLEVIAENSGVELKLTFEDFPEEIDIGGRYQQGLGVSAEIIGSYQEMVSWVRGIQQLPYFMRFSEVKMGTLEDRPGVRAEFKGTIFLRNVK